ncbi:hypothetical protein OEA41_006511 [Lepraria neglecta]|uniref:Uncharacterized protein n=1 Tax=Lepraria neglecta TaxID=209136 RepID=A0AAD9ZBC1_9LECA|nr:hypothetical protein OEA41_006511 [Lepraria neglecta]
MSSIDKKNSHAIFAFSGLVVPYTQASAWLLGAPDPTQPEGHMQLPDWFSLLCGTHMLLYSIWNWLRDGPLAVLFERIKYTTDYARNPNDASLAVLLPLLSPSIWLSAEQEKELDVCRSALDRLRRKSAVHFSPCGTLGVKAAAHIWPGIVSQEYMGLLQRDNPEALIILANYCVLLKSAGSCWYMEHHSERLFREIDLRLDATWKP